MLLLDNHLKIILPTLSIIAVNCSFKLRQRDCKTGKIFTFFYFQFQNHLKYLYHQPNQVWNGEKYICPLNQSVNEMGLSGTVQEG